MTVEMKMQAVKESEVNVRGFTQQFRGVPTKYLEAFAK